MGRDNVGSDRLSDGLSLPAPDGLRLAVRTAQHTNFPGVTIQRIGFKNEVTSLQRLTPTSAASLGAQLIAAAAIAAGRLDSADPQVVLDHAQVGVDFLVRQAQERAERANCRRCKGAGSIRNDEGPSESVPCPACRAFEHALARAMEVTG